MARWSIVVSFVTLCQLCFGQHIKFPDGFVFGVATASHQIEGAWDEDGKSENVWDRLTHTRPEMVADGTNGDIACDSYHRYKEDVEELSYLGVDFYRFSLSWARILPTGRNDQINPGGIRYYNELLDALLEKNIEPLVTLFHWDLPQTLQDLGGWANPKMIDYFKDYADVCYREFGDKIKLWITFNEPYEICEDAYGDEKKAPALNSHGVGNYLCSDTLLKAHAEAYHLYNDTYRSKQDGKVMISINSIWYEPSDPKNDEQIALAEIANQFKRRSVYTWLRRHEEGGDEALRDRPRGARGRATTEAEDAAIVASHSQDPFHPTRDTATHYRFGWIAHPIFTEEGGYPKVMIENVAKQSEIEGLTKPRLEQFDDYWIKRIKGTSDFLGINHYTTHLIMGPGVDPTAKSPSWLKDIGAVTSMKVGDDSASEWLRVVPTGFANFLRWCKSSYDDPLIYITENGFSDRGTLQDYGRIKYYNDYLTEILNVIYDDKVQILGYTAWTLMDNFEWRAGFSERFGFYYVNITDSNRPRTAKLSAEYYRQLIKNKELPQEEHFKDPANYLKIEL